MGFLHHNQIFNVIIEKSDYEIKDLMMMRKAVGFWPTEIEHVERVIVANGSPPLRPFFEDV